MSLGIPNGGLIMEDLPFEFHLMSVLSCGDFLLSGFATQGYVLREFCAA